MLKVFNLSKGFSVVGLLVLLTLVLVGGFVGYQYLIKKENSQNVVMSPKRVGIMNNTTVLESVYEGFKEGMVELGYIEGKNISYEYEYTAADKGKIEAAAKKFVSSDVDLILAITGPALSGALKETTASGKLIPIVFTNSNTALKEGFIKSLQSSGNHSTGLIPDDIAVSVKKLEFLKEIDPNAKRVGIFYSNKAPSALFTIEELEKESKKLSLTIVKYQIDTPPGEKAAEAVKKVGSKIKKGEIDAIMTVPEPVMNTPEPLKALSSLGIDLGVPTLFLNIEDGGLLGYNHDLSASGKQAALMADKIFKGKNPMDIPIDFPRKNLLVIDLKVAKMIGITIPASLLQIADKKIE